MLVWKPKFIAIGYKAFVSVAGYGLTWTQTVHDSFAMAFFWMTSHMNIYLLLHWSGPSNFFAIIFTTKIVPF